MLNLPKIEDLANSYLVVQLKCAGNSNMKFSNFNFNFQPANLWLECSDRLLSGWETTFRASAGTWPFSWALWPWPLSCTWSPSGLRKG